jgi:trimeric autotransporter adhesin
MSNVLSFANSGNSYVGTSFTGDTFIGNGAGLTNVPMSAGSPYYIQNGSSQQTGASFNIDGNGTVGGTLTGTTNVNTSGTYQIGGYAVFNVAPYGTGTDNTFVGYSAGVNDTGNQNTFVGNGAGFANVSGTEGTFVGVAAGGDSLAPGNTLMGYLAGFNITTGGYNSIFGANAGSNLITGNSNVYIASPGGTSSEGNPIRIGTQGAGQGQQNTTYIAGIHETTVSGGSPVFIDSTGLLGTVGGTLSGNAVNSSTNYQIGGIPIRVREADNYGVFVGQYAGQAITSGTINTFVGAYAGQNTTTGQTNTFLGTSAGQSSISGTSNTLLRRVRRPICHYRGTEYVGWHIYS